MISATISANSLEIGSRNITLTGIQFEHNSPGQNQALDGRQYPLD